MKFPKIAFVCSLIFAFGCANESPWAGDERVVSELSEDERDDFCEYHAEEKTCDPDRTIRTECEYQLDALASRECAVMGELAECWGASEGCSALECGYGCEADCRSKSLDECESTPGCSVRLGGVKTDEGCLEEVEAHCQPNWQNCNNAASYVRDPDGRCVVFGNSCGVPTTWGPEYDDACADLTNLPPCD